MSDHQNVSAVPELRASVNELPGDQITSFRPFDALAPDRQTAAARESTTLILEMAAFIRECAEHPKLNKTEKAIAQALLDRLILAGFTNGGPDTPPTEAVT